MASRFNLSFLSDSFISPWKDKERAKILLSGILGGFCYSVQSLALNYELGGTDLQNSLTFQILRFTLLGFLGIPFSFWILTKNHARGLLAIIQILGSCLFFIDPKSGLISAIAYAISVSPFCAVYNYYFALKQTTANRNNETALSNYTLIFVGSLGLLCGGWLLQEKMYLLAVMIGCGGGVIATYIMYPPIEPKNYLKRTRTRLGWKKPSNRISFMTSANGILIDSCLPMWMNNIGISPLSAGFNMALRPFLGIFLTPLFGWLMKKGIYKTAQYITIMLAIGWLTMMAASYWHFLIPISLTILMSAMNLMSPMEMNRWFKRRSVSATIAREGLFAAGRIPTYLVGIPLLFTAPVLFPILGFGVGVFFAYGMIYRKKTVRERVALWWKDIHFKKT